MADDHAGTSSSVMVPMGQRRRRAAAKHRPPKRPCAAFTTHAQCNKHALYSRRLLDVNDLDDVRVVQRP